MITQKRPNRINQILFEQCQQLGELKPKDEIQDDEEAINKPDNEDDGHKETKLVKELHNTGYNDSTDEDFHSGIVNIRVVITLSLSLPERNFF